MRARVLHNFLDLEAKVNRKIGDEFEAAAERIAAINAAGHGQLVEALEEKKKAPKKAKKVEVE